MTQGGSESIVLHWTQIQITREVGKNNQQQIDQHQDQTLCHHGSWREPNK